MNDSNRCYLICWPLWIWSSFSLSKRGSAVLKVAIISLLFHSFKFYIPSSASSCGCVLQSWEINLSRTFCVFAWKRKENSNENVKGSFSNVCQRDLIVYLTISQICHFKVFFSLSHDTLRVWNATVTDIMKWW